MANSDSAEQTPYIPGRNFDNATLTDRVYSSLREDILFNRLPPGAPLAETAVAAALNVSRGPVREALRRLDAEGLVTVTPRRGAVVSSFTPEEFLDAYRVREALEVLAIRLATLHLSEANLTELERLHEDMLGYAEAEDIDGFFTANAAFHATFVNASQNKKLQEIYRPLVNQMRRYRLSSLSLRGGMLRSCEEHGNILEAVKQKNADEAARLLRAHIQVPQAILESDSSAELLPRHHQSQPIEEGESG